MATQKRFIAKNGLDNNAQTITNVATPVNTTDAVTKAYADLKAPLASPTFTGTVTAPNSLVKVTSSSYPAIRPSLNLDFANSQSVDPRITFTRASTATRVRQNGLIEVVESGSPRIDFDPATNVCKGLLIEEQRTNLLTYSENFDNSVWTTSNSSISPNFTTSPDGTVSAGKLVENMGSGVKQLYQTGISFTTGTVVTMSFYAKAGERNYIVFGSGSAFSSNYSGYFNLLTGVCVSTGATVAVLSSINIGNGWYRYSITAIPTTTMVGVSFDIRSSIDGIDTGLYTGDGTSGVYIWGAQLEEGAFPTSYIPTVASQATRAADTAVMTGTNFSSWYNQTEGTMLCNFIPKASASNRTIWNLNNQSGSECFQLRYSSGSALQYGSTDNGIEQWSIAPTGYSSLNTRYLHAAAYKANDIASSVNGSSILSDSSASLASPTQLNFGTSYNSVLENLNGYIAKLTYYPKRLTNSELQGLATT